MATPDGGAHPAYLTAAEITVEADGRFHGQVRFDALAFALNDTSARIGNEPMESILAGPRDALEAQLTGARERFQRAFRVVTDVGDGTLDELDFPDAAAMLTWRDGTRPVLPVVIPARVSGRLPPGARTVAVRFPSVLEQVILTIQRPDEEPEAEPVEAGKLSTALAVRLSVPPKTAADVKSNHPVETSTGSGSTKGTLTRAFVTFCAAPFLMLLVILSRKRR